MDFLISSPWSLSQFLASDLINFLLDHHGRDHCVLFSIVSELSFRTAERKGALDEYRGHNDRGSAREWQHLTPSQWRPPRMRLRNKKTAPSPGLSHKRPQTPDLPLATTMVQKHNDSTPEPHDEAVMQGNQHGGRYGSFAAWLTICGGALHTT